MYLDCNRNVTVGVGHLLTDKDKAKALPFIERLSGNTASKAQVAVEFDRVQTSTLAPGDWQAFRAITSVDLPEPAATALAEKDMDMLFKILRSTNYFPEFDSYLVEAKMGILDMTYTLGAKKLRDTFTNFVPAARRRNWSLAAKESSRSTVGSSRNAIVRRWFEQAARQEHFFIHPTCRKRLNQLIK